MRIGFDVSQTGQLKAGCGFYAYNLIRELAELDEANEYILYPAVGDLFWDPDCDGATFQTARANFKRAPAPKSFEESQRFWRNPPADFELQLGNPDVFHSNNFFCPEGLRRARLLYTLYDLSFLEEPAWTTEANRSGCFSGVFKAALYADAIVAISEFSRRHFLRIFPHYPPERVFVVYPASRFHQFEDAPPSEKLAHLKRHGFWLNVATIEPRKNHPRLLEAYARVSSQRAEPMPLVIAGGMGWLGGEFERSLDRLGLRDRVLLTGYISDEELRWLYQNCFAFIYPSLFEGFGMPVLEAMSLGAPVICSNTSSLPEIAGDAALLVDPLDAEALAAQMLKLCQGSVDRDRLRELGFSQARKFSWRSSARRLLELYRQTLAAPAWRSQAGVAAKLRPVSLFTRRDRAE